MQLAQALYRAGKQNEAAVNLRAALHFNPGNFSAASNLAWILATSPDDQVRNGEEAVRLAKGLLQATKGEDPRALDTYAAALAEAGHFGAAVQHHATNQLFIEMTHLEDPLAGLCQQQRRGEAAQS